MGTNGRGAISKRAYDLLSEPLVARMLLSYQVRRRFLGAERAYLECSERASSWPGLRGERTRRLLHIRLGTPVGEGTLLRFGSILERPPLSIGTMTVIGHYTNIQHATIGNDCLIGDFVWIVDGSRQHEFARLDLPIREQGIRMDPVTIGNDCLIGGMTMILADVGNRCVVGAGSVVTRPVPDFKIVAGNPARVIGDRRERAS